LRIKVSHPSLLKTVYALLPSARTQGAQRLIVAQPTRKALLSATAPLPREVQVLPCPLRGPRQPRRKARYGNYYYAIANWPESHLDEARIPLLVSVTEGEASLYIADYVLRCRAGSFVIIPAGVPYGGIWRPHQDFGATESEDCEILTLCSWQGEAARVHCWTSRSHNGRVCNEGTYTGQISDPRVARYLQALVEEAIGVDHTSREEICSVESLLTEWQDTCSGLWLALLSALLREIKSDRIAYLKPKYSAEPLAGLDNKPISRAQEYIARHLNQPLTIDLAARAVYMSRARFTECFRKETGQSFNEYVTAQRLREARRMLHETNWPLHHIAHAVGLSTSRMRGLFHEHGGLSPDAYRRGRQSNRKAHKDKARRDPLNRPSTNGSITKSVTA
jgi:AraC-like DNA-binding protein